MKKARKAVVLVLLVVIMIVCTGCGSKDLESITRGRNGGYLRANHGKYDIIEIGFYGTKEACPKGNTNCCHIYHRVYRDNPMSPSGMSQKECIETCTPCEFDDTFLTLDGIDTYTYHVEKIGKSEYVVFSKDFFGNDVWYIDK